MTPMAESRQILSPEEAAAYLNFSPAALLRWRWLGIGPNYAKTNDLDAWIESQTEDSDL